MSKLAHMVAWFGFPLVFTCVAALLPSSGEAAIYLGSATQAEASSDPLAIDFVVDPDPNFTVADNQIAKDDGSIEGLLGAFFTVTEGDGTTYVPGTSLTIKWTLTGVPEIFEPIYFILKWDAVRDVYQFDTASGDTKTDLGGGLFTYMSEAIPTDVEDAPTVTQGISHVSVFAEGVVPEPSALAIWAGLAGLGAAGAGVRRRRAAASKGRWSNEDRNRILGLIDNGGRPV